MRNEQSRALHHLRELLEDSDLRQRDVEDRLGWTRGYLSQLLSGRVELRLRHLEAVLEALDVAPAEYFGVLFPTPQAGQRRVTANLEPGYDEVQVATCGIKAIRELARRVERCERALADLAGSGALERLINDGASPARRAARG